jgi:hypothetical protein
MVAGEAALGNRCFIVLSSPTEVDEDSPTVIQVHRRSVFLA